MFFFKQTGTRISEHGDIQLQSVLEILILPSKPTQTICFCTGSHRMYTQTLQGNIPDNWSWLGIVIIIGSGIYILVRKKY